MELAASQKASPVMDAWSMANFERYSMNSQMHSRHDCKRQRNMFCSLSSRALSMACRIISTAVMMAEPKETVPNDGPNACLVDVNVKPLNDLVPFGAKYH